MTLALEIWYFGCYGSRKNERISTQTKGPFTLKKSWEKSSRTYFVNVQK